MAARGIENAKKGETSNPLSLGKAMRQGPDTFFSQPAGLAAAMKQGKSEKSGDSPKLLGGRMRQGSLMLGGKSKST